jgi:hypothetical protein
VIQIFKYGENKTGLSQTTRYVKGVREFKTWLCTHSFQFEYLILNQNKIKNIDAQRNPEVIEPLIEKINHVMVQIK